MMNRVDAKNGYVFVRPIQETKTTGGLELISKYDEQDRYAKATVVFAEDIEEGSEVLYDKNNGHGFQINDELLTVLHITNIVGIYEKG